MFGRYLREIVLVHFFYVDGIAGTGGEAMAAERAVFFIDDANDLPFGNKNRRTKRDTVPAGDTLFGIDFDISHIYTQKTFTTEDAENTEQNFAKNL